MIWDEKAGLWVLNPSRDRSYAKHAQRYVKWQNPRGLRVLDLGATVGDYARACILAGAARVWSFEAKPEFEEVYKRNTEGMNVSFFAYSVTSEVQEYTRRVGSWVSIGSALRKSEPHVIKCDIEGHEYEIFPCELPETVQTVIVEFHGLASLKRRSKFDEICHWFACHEWTMEDDKGRDVTYEQGCGRLDPKVYNGFPHEFIFRKGGK